MIREVSQKLIELCSKNKINIKTIKHIIRNLDSKIFNLYILIKIFFFIQNKLTVSVITYSDAIFSSVSVIKSKFNVK
jgi:hypothetical protein